MLLDVIFFCLYVLPLVLLLLYRNRSGAQVLRINCSGLLVIFYLVANHFGLISFYLAETGIKQIEKVNKSTVVLLCGYSLIVVVAYIFMDLVFKQLHNRYRYVRADVIAHERLKVFPILVVLIICALLALFEFFDDSPLLLLLSGNVVGGHEARLNNYSNNISFLGIKPSHLKVFFEIAQFSMIISLVKFSTTKKFKYVLLYILFLLIVLLDSMNNTAKGAIIIPIYQLWIMYALLFSHSKLNNRMVGIGIIFALTVVATFSSFIMGNLNVDLFYPFERLFLGNLVPQYTVVNHFHFDNLLYGSSVPTWVSLGQHKQFLIDVFAWKEIMNWNEGAFYTAPSSFVAHAHANFHFIGVIVLSIILFFVLNMVDLLLLKIRSETIYASLLIYSCLHFSNWAIAGGPATMFMFDYYYAGVLLFSFLCYLFQNTYIIPYRYRSVLPRVVKEGKLFQFDNGFNKN